MKDYKVQITANGFKMNLNTGWIISVVGGDGLYGDGVETFEVGVWHSTDNIATKVAGYQTVEEVDEFIRVFSILQ